MRNNGRKTIKGINILLVALISSVTITGLSFIDDQIWHWFFIGVGVLAYLIVGGLISLGILSTKRDMKDAYLLVFFLLLLGAWGIYELLNRFQQWVLGWPLAVRIIVPSLLGAGIIGVVVFKICKKRSEKKKQEENEEGSNNPEEKDLNQPSQDNQE